MVIQLLNITTYFCYIIFNFSGIIVYVVYAITMLHEILTIVRHAVRPEVRIVLSSKMSIFIIVLIN